MAVTRELCVRRDRDDPLAALRDQFVLAPGLIYLDGNSLGPLPVRTAGAVRRVIEAQWGSDLISSWNRHGWITLPLRLGDTVAGLIGGGAGNVLVADSTSINLYKVLTVALRLGRQSQRTQIVSESRNFPGDLYVAKSVAAANGGALRVVPDAVAALDERTAVLLLTQVDYRTGALHDVSAVTAAAHAAGALVVWDLAHSAGVVPIDLLIADADFAVGCGYKYLNGGPGAPAFLFVHPRHVDELEQPLAGWLGHRAPFEFSAGYSAADGIGRYQSGTPAVLAMAALECGLETVSAAEPLGGIVALRNKSLALTSLFIELVDPLCTAYGLSIATPREPSSRGSQVSMVHGEDAHALVQALIARGVVGDFRTPDIARFGCAPLFTRFVDVYDAVQILADVLRSELWREPQYAAHSTVT